MALSSDELIASYSDAGGRRLRRPALATAHRRAGTGGRRGGLQGHRPRADDFDGGVPAGLRGAIEAAGVQVVELEFVSGWSSDSDAVWSPARNVEEQLYAAHEALGGSQLNVGCSEPIDVPAPFEAVVERFAALCQRAAAHELTVALEFMPWTAIPDAATAWRIVRAAGCDNGGVLLDVWHYFRGAADPSQLRAIPAERIVGLQINDAAAAVVGTLREDTLHRRRLPGEGVFDLTGLVHLLRELGVRAPWAVEVISDAQAALPLSEAASRAFDATSAVLNASRG